MSGKLVSSGQGRRCGRKHLSCAARAAGAFLVVGSVLFASSAAKSESVEIDVAMAQGTGTQRQVLYKDSFALLIRESAYEVWDKLAPAASKFDLVAAALKKQHFAVTEIQDLGSRDLFPAIKSFLALHKGPENRILIYFSGHGWSDPQQLFGYIVPIDAPLPDENSEKFLSKLTSMNEIVAISEIAEYRHQLWVFDSCFSGAIMGVRGEYEAPDRIYVDDLLHPARQFITSGDQNQKVPEISTFAEDFAARISGEGFGGADGILTADTLGEQLKKDLTKKTHQTPQHGYLHSNSINEGQFIFVLPKKDEVVGRIISADVQAGLDTQRRPSAAGADDVVENTSVVISRTGANSAFLPGASIKTAVPKNEQSQAAPTHPPAAQNSAAVSIAYNKVFSGLNIYYFRKAGDGKAVIDVLDRLGAPYDVRRAILNGDLRTNAVLCHPDTSIEALKELAFALINGGVPLQAIEQFQGGVASKEPGRIDVVTLSDGDGKQPSWPALRHEQIDLLSSCPKLLRNR